MRLSGQYRGWPALEALFDKSARAWDQAGMLVEKEQDEFGLESKSHGGTDANGLEDRSSPLIEGVSLPENPSLLVSDSDAAGKPRLLVSSTPSASSFTANQDRALLSPPPSKLARVSSSTSVTSSRHSHTASLPPKPVDLPTRSDVIAAEAVAIAEEQHLRGGWVMGGLTTEGRSYSEVETKDASDGTGRKLSMVDVDLEEGLGERFGKRLMDGNNVENGTGGMLSPSPRPSLSSFFVRRSSDGRLSPLPQELPLPMSLPPTPPQSFSPPPSNIELPSRMKSPLNISTVLNPSNLERSEETPETAQPTIRLVGGNPAREKEDEDGMMDINLGTAAIELDTPAEEKEKRRNVLGGFKGLGGKK